MSKETYTVGTRTNQSTHFFKDKPIFGFDIGHGSLKVMQVSHAAKRPRVIGYGTATFDANAIKDGIITDHKAIAEAGMELFKNHLVGDITTPRVVIAIPTYRTYSRLISLPPLEGKELREAVELEAEQYIPVPIEDLYLDYNVVARDSEKMDVFAIGVPRKIVDSQLQLMRILGLETVGLETTIDAAGKLFLEDAQSDVPAVLIDFGSLSADISIFDKNMLVSGTVSGGGLVFTNRIRDGLGVTQAEAQIIKTKYGLGPSKKQKEIYAALDPVLSQLAQEVRRMIRYYEDRFGTERKITQVVTLGGGANMPGLSEYMTSNLRLAVRACDPWEYVDHKGLQPPARADKNMYATVMGLSLIKPKELFS
ncbi:MAG TPA: type IV pilus assembly protein PilM [Candidatus Limnocylindrales bacterium]|nr:type IV pilus assembly protein PilM [Candidatus Limnocylindrales bacterium]